MKHIILLRGVNVGGRTIKMADLKTCMENGGFRNVITVLQTGNVVVDAGKADSEKLRLRVEKLLGDTFHYPAKVLALSPAELETVIRGYPFQNPGPDVHRYVVFTEKGFEETLAHQAPPLDASVEAVSPGEGVVYWRVRKGQTLDSVFGKYMAKAAAKQFITNRNLNTLEKILAKCG
ncbi:DUF1697 domain-containing protein [Compostibacter hankyongensis]|uniref:DUF1697 domain-containing protein n=1 Tax=Compostibacter hankyongensis TaxID=1007089 RepID=UPI0031EE8DB1